MCAVALQVMCAGKCAHLPACVLPCMQVLCAGNCAHLPKCATMYASIVWVGKCARLPACAPVCAGNVCCINVYTSQGVQADCRPR